MNRALLFMLISCYLSGMPAPVIGSETRVNTLGGVGEFLIDNSNVRLYPALVNEYPNEIIGEIKRCALGRQAVACYIGVGKLGVVGLGLNIDTVHTIVNRAINKAGSWRFNTASPAVTIYYGSRVIRSSSLGLKFSYSNSYYEEGEWAQEIKVQSGEMGASVAIHDESYIELSGGIARFGFESKKDEYEPTEFKDRGKMSFNVRARLLSKIFPNCLFILGANYDKIDVSWEEVRSQRGEDLTSSAVDGYVGMNLTILDRTSLTIGAILSQAKGDTSTKDTSFTNTSWELPKLVLGVETGITDWLTVRLGGWKAFIETESSTTTEDIEISRKRLKEEKFSLSFGWGIRIEGFELDVMANDLPFAAPSIGLSATYRFQGLFPQ